MMIHSVFKDYQVTITKQTEILKELANYEQTMYVIDKNVHAIYQPQFAAYDKDRMILIDATEENKVVETALEICEKMTELSAKRNAHLVSIGGGIVQDITGFVANILYRGIRWTFVPTTLLASCDSCIGGKSSLNYKNFKNLLGSFYPPDQIFICTDFFNSLSEADFMSGLGEVIKFNIMAGISGLNRIEEKIDLLLQRDSSCLMEFVNSSLSFKKGFIEIDEFDHGERIKLNFAHTFGHAIESVTHFRIPHGTAVAIGMIMANYISVKRGLLDEEIAKRSEAVLKRVIHVTERLDSYSIDEYIKAIRKDKKQQSANLTAVLMTNTDKGLKIIHDLTESEIKCAISHFCSIIL